MRYLMQLRQSPSMVVPRAEASPCPCKTKRHQAKHLRDAAKRIHTREAAARNPAHTLMSSATQTQPTHADRPVASFASISAENPFHPPRPHHPPPQVLHGSK